MTDSQGPLTGVRVLDLSRAIAGPYCTMLLGDFGADVIKVESPTGDMGRAAGLAKVGGESTYYLSMNRNKRSIVIDLRTDDGKRVLSDLVKWADVLVENFRPGVLERLGFGPERLEALNDTLVLCSISGYGQVGPYRGLKALDLIGQAMGGLASLTGEADGPPTPAGAPISDVLTGLNACVALLAALAGRSRNPDSAALTTVDVSLVASTISALTVEATSYLNTGEVPSRHGSAWFQVFPYDVFPTADGWIAIGTGKDWVEFCELVGAQELADQVELQGMELRLERRHELKQVLSEATKGWKTDDLAAALRARDILSSPVYSVADTVHDEGLRGEGVQLTFDHEVYGSVQTVDSAPIFWKGAPGGERWEKQRNPAPLMGEHTMGVLRELGYPEEEVEQLCRDGGVAFLP